MKNYKKIILNNGIPLYLYNDKSLKQVFVNYIVKYGSSGEWFNFKLNGINHKVSAGHAHFLEHLLLEHSKYGDIISNYNKRCYNTNALTYTDHTSFFFYGVDDIKKSIKELIETIDTPVFNYKDVNEAKHAIVEEASMSCDDPQDALTALVERNLYGDFELFDESLSSIGDKETNRKITTRDLKTCYEAFYNDDNKVLVIAGNVNEEELVDYLNEIYDNIPRHKSNLILPNYNYEPIRKKEDYLDRDIPPIYTGVGIKMKKPDDVTKRDMDYLYTVLINYLFDDTEFVEDLKNRGLMDELLYCYNSVNGNYYNFIHSVVSSNFDEYFKRLLDKLNKRDITREDYELIRKIIIADNVRRLDDKYDSFLEFGLKMRYTTDYSDIDYLRSFDYDRYKDMLNKVDYDTYTLVKVKK